MIGNKDAIVRGAAWNALVESETRESLADMYLGSLQESRSFRERIVSDAKTINELNFQLNEPWMARFRAGKTTLWGWTHAEVKAAMDDYKRKLDAKREGK